MIYFYTPVQDDKALLELCTPPPIYKPGFGIAEASSDGRRCPSQVSPQKSSTRLILQHPETRAGDKYG